MTTHEQRKRRNAGCRKSVPRPLCARLVTVNDGAPLNLVEFNAMVAAVRARRDPTFAAMRRLFAWTFSAGRILRAAFRAARPTP